MKWLNEQGSLLRKFLAGGFRRTLGYCALGFVATLLLGAGIGMALPEEAARMMNDFMEQAAQSGVVTEEGELSVFALLMNNWRAMLISAAYGFVPFLFLPVISLVTNGALLGMLAALFVSQGTSLLVYLAGILPHGIFEIPALVFSLVPEHVQSGDQPPRPDAPAGGAGGPAAGAGHGGGAADCGGGVCGMLYHASHYGAVPLRNGPIPLFLSAFR